MQTPQRFRVDLANYGPSTTQSRHWPAHTCGCVLPRSCWPPVHREEQPSDAAPTNPPLRSRGRPTCPRRCHPSTRYDRWWRLRMYGHRRRRSAPWGRHRPPRPSANRPQSPPPRSAARERTLPRRGTPSGRERRSGAQTARLPRSPKTAQPPQRGMVPRVSRQSQPCWPARPLRCRGAPRPCRGHAPHRSPARVGARASRRARCRAGSHRGTP